MNKYSLLVLSIFLLSACGTKYDGHIAHIPSVNLSPQKIYTPNSDELQKAKLYARYLVQKDIKPIYFFVEAKKLMMRDETGNGTGTLPNNFRLSAMYAMDEFSPKIKVITGLNSYLRANKDKNKRPLLFEVEGALVAYDKDRHEINSGIEFGLDFGKGRGDTDVKDRFRNVDKVSSLGLIIMLKKDGEIFTKARGVIDIQQKGRGYNFGLSINNSGFGVSAFQRKKEGMGESIDRLLLHTLHSMIKDVVERKGLVQTRVVRPRPTPPIQQDVVQPPIPQPKKPITQQIKRMDERHERIKKLEGSITLTREDEDDFLNKISKKRR
jgi:hypothetical protein